jgi:hypothetical protein
MPTPGSADRQARRSEPGSLTRPLAFVNDAPAPQPVAAQVSTRVALRLVLKASPEQEP